MPITDLPVPQTGAIQDLPVPQTSSVVSPEQADVEGFTATAGPMRRGMRAAANNIGATLNGIIASTGDALGLTQFAEDRYAEARRYTDFANSVDHEVRDYGAVKDFNSLIDYVAGNVGKGIVSSLPAIGLAVGLRRPVAGVLAGSFPQEAGEQALSLRDNPNVMANTTPGQRFGNAVAKGTINSFLELGGVEGQAARKLLKPSVAKGIGKAVVKGTVGEGVTEAAQEGVGQGLEQQLDPTKELDPHQIANAGLAGAVGGAAIGGGAHGLAVLPGAVARTADELKTRLGSKEKPISPDPEAIPEEATKLDTKEQIMEFLQKADDKWQETYGKMKDPAEREAFAKKAMDTFYNETTRPHIDRVLEAGKAVKEFAQSKIKKSEMDNKGDFMERRQKQLTEEKERLTAERNRETDKARQKELDAQIMSNDEEYQRFRKQEETRLQAGKLSLVKNPTPQEFEERLKKHDWLFEMTEDPSVWRRGLAESKELQEVAKLSPEHKAAYDRIKKEEHDDVLSGVRKPQRSSYTPELSSRGPEDDDILDFMSGEMDQDARDSASPEQLQGLQKLVRDFTENPSAFKHVHRSLKKVFGDKFDKITDYAIERTTSSDEQMKAKKREIKLATMPQDQLEEHRNELASNIMRTYAKPDYSVKPELRKAMLDEMGPRILDFVDGNPDKRFEQAMKETTGENFDKAMNELEQLKDIKPTTSGRAFEGQLAEPTTNDEGDEARVVKDEGFTTQESVLAGSPAADQRLNRIYSDKAEAEKGAETLRSEYGPKTMKFSVASHGPLLGEEGYAGDQFKIQADDADQEKLTTAELRRVREVGGQSGLENGLLVVKTEQHPAGVKINLVRLTHLMMAKEGQQTQEGGERYVADMFSRGMSSFLRTMETKNPETGEVVPAIKGFAKSAKRGDGLDFDKSGNWALPDNTKIAVLGGKTYTYGDIKVYRLTANELAGITDEDIKFEEQVIKEERQAEGKPAYTPSQLNAAAINKVTERSQRSAEAQTYYEPHEDNQDTGIAQNEQDQPSRDVHERRQFNENTGRISDEVTGAPVQGREPAIGSLEKGQAYVAPEPTTEGNREVSKQTTAENIARAKAAQGLAKKEGREVGEEASKKIIEAMYPGVKKSEMENKATTPRDLSALRVNDFEEVESVRSTAFPKVWGVKNDYFMVSIGQRPDGTFYVRLDHKTRYGGWAVMSDDKSNPTYKPTKTLQEAVSRANEMIGVHLDNGGPYAVAIRGEDPAAATEKLLGPSKFKRSEMETKTVSPEEFSKQLMKKYPYGVTVKLSDYGNSIELESIGIQKDMRGKGLGSRVMSDIIAYADKAGKGIFLHASPSNDSDMSLEQLEKFYKGFGFTAFDMAERSAPGLMTEMYRNPIGTIDEETRRYDSTGAEGTVGQNVQDIPGEVRRSEQNNKATETPPRDLTALRVNDFTEIKSPNPTAFPKVWAVSNGLFQVGIGQRPDGTFYVRLDQKTRHGGWGVIDTDTPNPTRMYKPTKTLQEAVSRANELIGFHLDFEPFAARMRGENPEAADEKVLGPKAPTTVEGLRKELDKIKKGFSTQNVGSGTSTPEQQQAARDYVKRVLGDKVAVEFLDKMKNAGEFARLNDVETIKLSLNFLDPMSVAYHESLHALFARLIIADKKTANTLLRAAGSAPIVARLRELLKGHERALRQLSAAGQLEAQKLRQEEQRANKQAVEQTMSQAEAEHEAAEERLAYMYQFSALGEKGLVQIGPDTRTAFGKVKSFLRKISAIWSDEMGNAMAVEKAGELLDAFHQGKFADRSTVAEVLRDKFPMDPEEKARKIMPALGKFMDKFIWTASGALRDTNDPALIDIANKFHSPVEGGEPGFLQTRHTTFNGFMNRANDALKGLGNEQLRNVLIELQNGKEPTSQAGRAIRGILDDVHAYMQKAGVKRFVKDEKGKVVYKKGSGEPELEDIGFIENYFPRVSDSEYVRDHKEEFIALLRKHNIQSPEDVWKKYSESVDEGSPKEEDYVLGLSYYTPSTNERTLNDIPDAELAPFLSKDIVGTMSQYLSRAARRGEYTKRFGNSGEVITKAFKEAGLANPDGKLKPESRVIGEAVQAMEGTLGANMSQELKNIYGALTTYQNIRLLPLALFSSFVDPLGIVVRGGTMKEAGGAFVRGIRELAGFKDDDAYQLAKTIGAINTANDAQVVGDMYSSQFMPNIHKRINDKFFRMIGMESYNRSMRVAAAAAAEQFLIRHGTKPTEHSERYLTELGLTKDDISIVNDKLVLSEKVTKAMNQWIDQAILRPNAALRPVYMSDPNWILISHLKQYTYMFQKVILARVHHELQHGNYTPLYGLMGYVPLIIASDMLRAGLTPSTGDDKPDWDVADWLWRGVQRAGFFGPGQYMIDSGSDFSKNHFGIESIVGPTGQQLLDFVRASASGQGVWNELKKAIPGARLVN